MTTAIQDKSNHTGFTIPQGLPSMGTTFSKTVGAAHNSLSSNQNGSPGSLESKTITNDTQKQTPEQSGTSAPSLTPKPKQDLRRAGMKRINNVAIAATITFIAIIIIAIVVSVLGAKGYLAPLTKAKIWGVISNGLVNGYHGAQHFFVHTKVGRVVGGALLGAAAISSLAIAHAGLKALFGKQSPGALPFTPEIKQKNTESENSSTPALKTNREIEPESETVSPLKDSKTEEVPDVKLFEYEKNMTDEEIVNSHLNMLEFLLQKETVFAEAYKRHPTKENESELLRYRKLGQERYEKGTKHRLAKVIEKEVSLRFYVISIP